MNLEEARKIMKEPPDQRTFRLVRAATVICSPDNADRVPINELVDCLKRGNESRRFALLAEYAAVALYARTNRELKKGSLVVTDVTDWIEYLKRRRML